MRALQIFAECQDQLSPESSPACLFGPLPTLSFGDFQTVCEDCHGPLHVYKTQTKRVHTLHLGSFRARQTLRICRRCDRVYGSEPLSRLAPCGCRFGYDVLSFVGRELFVRHRQAQEIIEKLHERRVRISPSEVSCLGKKFVVYLALAHRECAPRIREAMRSRGGYVLHLDGTGEGGGPMLMSTLDSLSQIVLGNVKVPSEKAEQIIPLLQAIKSQYGLPVACVHDMGSGIVAAVKAVFEGVPDFICHFHFLRDIGKDLLQSDYDAIQRRLRSHGLSEKLLYHARRFKAAAIDCQSSLVESFCQSVREGCLPKQKLDLFPMLCAYALIQWVLDGKSQGEGYGFPFDRPHVEFAKRLLAMAQRLEQIKDIHLRGHWADNKPLHKLSCELKKLSADKGLRCLLESIDSKIEVFDRLRQAMRIAQLGGRAGLNSGSDPAPMGAIEKAVRQFRQEVVSRSDYQSAGHWKSLIAQIDKYQDKLFADPISVETASGPTLIQPQRTNNIMERFFRDWRRGVRRKSGHNSIGPLLRSMIADTPLVRNLENPGYMEALLDGHATLEERFAQIDIQTVRKELLAAQAACEKVPSTMRQLIALPSFPEAVCRLFRKAA